MIEEAAFNNAAINPGLEVWVIKKFKPVRISPKNHGKFYKEHSYIILITEVENGNKYCNISYWGQQSTIFAKRLEQQLRDNRYFVYCNSINKSDLQEILGDDFKIIPGKYSENGTSNEVLYSKNIREIDTAVVQDLKEIDTANVEDIQDNDTSNVKVIPGNVTSNVNSEDIPHNLISIQLSNLSKVNFDEVLTKKRLFQITSQSFEEIPFNGESINSNKCYVVDNVERIYVYAGKCTRNMEKVTASNLANQVRDEHNGKPKITTIDRFSTPSEVEEFFDVFGLECSEAITSTAKEKVIDEVPQRNATLHWIQKDIKQSYLDPRYYYILDITNFVIFIWLGKNCNDQDKQQALLTAEEYHTTKNYSKSVEIRLITQGSEPNAFKQCFESWNNEESFNVSSRLFVFRESKKVQILDFVQEDLYLNEDGVIIVENNKNVFIWSRKLSSEQKDKYKNVALQFLEPHQNSKNITIIFVMKGKEPQEFKNCFSTWKE